MMARNRNIFFQGQDVRRQDPLAQGVANIGAGLAGMVERAQRRNADREIARTKLIMIQRSDEQEKFQLENPDKPELWEQNYLKTTKETRGIISEGAKSNYLTEQEIPEMLEISEAQGLAKVQRDSARQTRINTDVDNRAVEISLREDEVIYHFDDSNEDNLESLDKKINDITVHYNSGGYTDKEAEVGIQEGKELWVGRYLTQSVQDKPEEQALKEIGNINTFAKENFGIEDAYSPVEITGLKRSYQAETNNRKRQEKEAFDLRGREIQQELWNSQKEGALTAEMLNNPEVVRHLSVPEQRTFWNSLNNTKTYTPEEKATAHTNGIETMVAFRVGELKQNEAKEKIDKLRAEGKIDPEDGEAWTEELLGFKKSPTAASGNATAMSLGVKSINQIKAIETKALEDAGGDVVGEIAKRNAERNQQIIDLEAWEKAEPRTPTEINQYVESVLAPAKDALAKDIVTKTWFERLYPKWTTLGLISTGVRAIRGEENPYKDDYPDAFKVGDNWYVMRDGKRHRIKD